MPFWHTQVIVFVLEALLIINTNYETHLNNAGRCVTLHIIICLCICIYIDTSTLYVYMLYGDTSN